MFDIKKCILFEDKDIIVCRKPAGIAVQNARIGAMDMESSLKNYLSFKSGNVRNVPYLAVVHRLDQPVEGLLVFARTPQAAAKLSKDLQNGSLKKYYHALVPLHPALDDQTGHLTDYLLKDGRTNLSRVVSPGNKNAKKAELDWKFCGQYEYNGEGYALVEIELFTGRHHQIRVQMAHAQMPLLGDNKYASKDSARLSEITGICHTALFASRLILKHPVSGKMLEYTLPFPEEWNIK